MHSISQPGCCTQREALTPPSPLTLSRRSSDAGGGLCLAPQEQTLREGAGAGPLAGGVGEDPGSRSEAGQ